MNKRSSLFGGIGLAVIAVLALAFATPANAAVAFTIGDQKVDQSTPAASDSAWPVYTGGFKYFHEDFTGDATQSIKSGAGVVHLICVGKPADSSVVKLYDGTDQSITANDKLILPLDTDGTGSIPLDLAFNTGLLVVQSGASSDIVVVAK